jgi:hypothetical protein
MYSEECECFEKSVPLCNLSEVSLAVTMPCWVQLHKVLGSSASKWLSVPHCKVLASLDAWDCGYLVYNTMLVCRYVPRFQRKLLFSSSGLKKLEAADTLKTAVPVYKTRWHHIPIDHNLNKWRKKPTKCCLVCYYTYGRLNMFQAPLCPSSGAHDYAVDYNMGRLVLRFLEVRCRLAG